MFALLKTTVRDFLNDDAPRMAAALSYYTIFALPPLLVLLITIAGTIWQPEDIQGSIETQMVQLIGEDGARAIRSMLENANRPGAGGVLPTLLSIGALLFGATGAFAQLQKALNSAWNVAPDPERSALGNMLMKRLLSLGMILVIGFLLLVSLALSAILSAFGDRLQQWLPEALSGALLQAIQLGASLVVITLLFAAIYKILPDAVIAWRDVWVGAAVTAALFVAGKFAIGFYLGQSDPGSAYGAAGSLAVVLIWVYFASMLLLLGAEFTEVWARRRGAGIRPEEGAIHDF